MKRELIKNGIMIGLIILFACFVTYKIYYKFHEERAIDYSSKSLDIVFHEKTGDKIFIDKLVPLTDNLGLSSKPYTFTVSNNLTEDVSFKIKLIRDEEEIDLDKCSDKLISEKYLKVSIKDDSNKTKIYNMEELKDDVLLDAKIKALEENTYTVRVWVKDDVESTDTDLHYHGKLQIVEDNNILARR